MLGTNLSQRWARIEDILQKKYPGNSTVKFKRGLLECVWEISGDKQISVFDEGIETDSFSVTIRYSPKFTIQDKTVTVFDLIRHRINFKTDTELMDWFMDHDPVKILESLEYGEYNKRLMTELNNIKTEFILDIL